MGDAETESAPPADEERFLGHLGRAGELIGGRQLAEAEAEVMRALELRSNERRALNLLALVRFKTGRFDDAAETYRTIVEVSPDDGAARFHLGLIALKRERPEEAVGELEMAGRLLPGDLRVWSYLGMAYARTGQGELGAAAFRRAGQPELAAKLEGQGEEAPAPAAETETPAGIAQAAMEEVAAPGFESDGAAAPVKARDTAEGDGIGVAGDGAAAAPEGEPEGLPAPASEPESLPPEVTDYALSRLLPIDAAGVGLVPTDSGFVRFGVRDEAYVRADVMLLGAGSLRWEAAERRAQGRLVPGPFGVGDTSFGRLRGSGDVWLGGGSRPVVALRLEDDILYMREERVVAFDGAVNWEAGRLPRNGLRLIQFRGKGQVALSLPEDTVAYKVDPDRPTIVSRGRILGWLGRVLPHADPGAAAIVCEGEGVVLLNGGSSGPG